MGGCFLFVLWSFFMIFMFALVAGNSGASLGVALLAGIITMAILTSVGFLFFLARENCKNNNKK